jgi:hypothetical protein
MLLKVMLQIFHFLCFVLCLCKLLGISLFPAFGLQFISSGKVWFACSSEQ